MVGAALRYGIGGWPLVLPGSAEVTACRPGRELALHGRTPFGGVDVRVRIDDAPSGCVLEITEDVVSGPAHLVPAPAAGGGDRGAQRRDAAAAGAAGGGGEP